VAGSRFYCDRAADPTASLVTRAPLAATLLSTSELAARLFGRAGDGRHQPVGAPKIKKVSTKIGNPLVANAEAVRHDTGYRTGHE
jgi:hypothetical protein